MQQQKEENFQIPTFEEYKNNKEYFDKLAKIIKNHKIDFEEEKVDKKIEQERLQFKNLSKEQFEKLIYNIEWIDEDDFYEYVNMQQVRCCMREIGDCWYEGNLDRIDEYDTYYRFPGQENVTLCKVCYKSDKDNDEIIEMIKDEYEFLCQNSDQE